MDYIVVDTVQEKCINIIVWDGVSVWNPPQNCIVQVSDGTVQIGDDVQQVDGQWVKKEE